MSWRFSFLLHNLQISRSFDTEYLAACRLDDPRLSVVYEKDPLAQVLTERFESPFGYQRSPTPVIVSAECPDSAKEWDSLVTWRNAYAIPSLLDSWQHKIRNRSSDVPLYSDYFEMYPIFITKDGSGLVARTLDVKNFDKPDGFKGQTSPGLSPFTWEVRWNDDVGKPILAAWQRKFVDGECGYKVNTLLRSIDVAFQANRMPGDDGATIYEFGSHVGLWVSAFEILCHPEKEFVGMGNVFDLFEGYGWIDNRLQLQDYESKRRPLTLAQEIYKQMYRARNDFVHGNEVMLKDLYVFENFDNLLLTQIAPILYWFALEAFLRKGGLAPSEESELEREFRRAMSQAEYEEALLLGAGINGEK